MINFLTLSNPQVFWGRCENASGRRVWNAAVEGGGLWATEDDHWALSGRPEDNDQREESQEICRVFSQVSVRSSSTSWTEHGWWAPAQHIPRRNYTFRPTVCQVAYSFFIVNHFTCLDSGSGVSRSICLCLSIFLHFIADMIAGAHVMNSVYRTTNRKSVTGH